MFTKIIATAFGAGYSPIAPGTAGALLAAVLLWGADALLQIYFPGWVGQEWPFLLVLACLFLRLRYAWGVHQLCTGCAPPRLSVLPGPPIYQAVANR